MDLPSRQRKIREVLAKAAARYANLHLGVGYESPVIRTLDRAGRPVMVTIRIEIVDEDVA